jgi:hypothetical protein
MKLARTVGGLAIILGLLCIGVTFASTASALDGRAEIQQEPAPGQHETPIQSVNGKVVDITSTQLTLEVQADGKSDTLAFIIDENTKTDGDIKPGIMATVDYHTKEGKKYAAHIMPAEAKKP